MQLRHFIENSTAVTVLAERSVHHSVWDQRGRGTLSTTADPRVSSSSSIHGPSIAWESRAGLESSSCRFAGKRAMGALSLFGV
ncbi:hypothetical protein MPTK1_8g10850 [Marchantia polymorpha subsp. ruderalis]|uniref:Uncharacterized protein n=1 Tax=Marchantia polymorpha TaxID=3197 RepID=A0A2R6XMP2_MARPO|nr:hypothetical protein MARPO_0008s0137 [Marchantia polymorpha]BBN19459.1 hypothetical protein Mp_8g10850 [Marchantia polymorpha subsp. ruderalis]|eukprot:PTQ47372.1 hypothetical protein MARPO_0008s0137 [Marchantia polymorpha]